MAEFQIKEGGFDLFERLGNMPPEALAGAFGVSYATYYRIKQGQQAPSAAFIAGVVRALNIPVESFAEVVTTTKARATA